MREQVDDPEWSALVAEMCAALEDEPPKPVYRVGREAAKRGGVALATFKPSFVVDSPELLPLGQKVTMVDSAGRVGRYRVTRVEGCAVTVRRWRWYDTAWNRVRIAWHWSCYAAAVAWVSARVVLAGISLLFLRVPMCCMAVPRWWERAHWWVVDYMVRVSGGRAR